MKRKQEKCIFEEWVYQMNPEDVASKKVTLEDCLHSFSVNSSNKEVDSELKKKGKRKFDLQVID